MGLTCIMNSGDAPHELHHGCESDAFKGSMFAGYVQSHMHAHVFKLTADTMKLLRQIPLCGEGISSS